MLADFRAMGHRCTAVETSDAARTTAEAFNSGASGVSIHASIDPAWHASFDCLASFEVLEHIEDDAAALSEWITFLRPNGHIVLSVPAGPHRWDASDDWAGHFRRYTREGLIELVTACGGQVERVETYGFPLANIIAPIRARSKARARQAGDIAERTAESGIERSAERRALPLLQSLPGRMALRGCFAMQALAANSDLGPAYLLLGRKA
jgi:SAM-dependent methyltransferase